MAASKEAINRDFVQPEVSRLTFLNAPLELWAFLFLCVAMGTILSKEFLIALGPLRQSLTSEFESVRAIAEQSVLIARFSFFAVALVTAAFMLFWNRLRASKAVTAVERLRVFSMPRGVMTQISRRSLYLSVTALTAAGVYVAFIAPMLSATARLFVNREDGLLEMTTAAMFVLASAFLFVALFQLLIQRISFVDCASQLSRCVIVTGLMAVVFIVCAGEEISWGQRFFGFETSELMLELNVQNEMNLHNSFGYLADHIFILGVAIYGAVIPYCAWRFQFVRKGMAWLGLPVASLGLALGFLGASVIHAWTFPGAIAHSGLRMAELREFLSAFCLLLLAYEHWVWARNGRPGRGH